MCDDPDLFSHRPGVYHESWRTARKQHVCYACRESIVSGRRYRYTFTVSDRDPIYIRHCTRCALILDAIQEFRPGVVVDLGLDCGETWEDALGEDPPDRVEALAFLLPGELPLRTQSEPRHSRAWSIGGGE
jgi:hypothetical protein